MTDDTHDYERKILETVDKGFERIAGELDEIASQHDVDSREMLAVLGITGSDFFNYFGDWMQETWEKRQAGVDA